jgi:NADPH-dependent 2,4-dienoyl-CoA reductase/sulfur reductase-like enzyme
MPPHHVIVGSGIAGLTAAEAIRQLDPAAAITMISEEAHDFYSRPGLAYLLRGDIPEKQLFVRSREEIAAVRLQRITARVTQVLPAQHELLLSNGQQLRYDRLLLGLGATAVPPAFPGAELGGIVKIDSLDDTRQILKQTGRRRTAVVVGGGITALELAEGLHARRMHVHYFLRSARYWSDVLDEAESRIVLERLHHVGIHIHLNTQVKQAVGAGGKLTGVETDAGVTIPCQMLAVAIGVRPRVDLARHAGLAVDRGILVNAYMQTSVPDIFAAGDAAQVHDPISGRTTVDVLWSTALLQGQIAGANMAGSAVAYVKGIPFNVTQLAGLKVTIIGAVGKGKDADLTTIARGDSEAWRLLPRAAQVTEQSDLNRVRLMVDERRIVGAVVMGDQAWSKPLQRLVAAQVDITPIRATLVRGGSAGMQQLLLYYQRWEETRRAGAG